MPDAHFPHDPEPEEDFPEPPPRLRFRWYHWGCLLLSTSGCLVFAAGLVFFLMIAAAFGPTNDRDNRDPAKQATMIALTREWARLAPFPSSAKDFRIWTEGNDFTRRFRATFSASPGEIRKWLRASPGTAETTPVWSSREISESLIGSEAAPPHEVRHYRIKPGGGAQYALVSVDELTSSVSIHVKWS